MDENTKWLVGIFGLIVIQLGAFAYSYGSHHQELRDVSRRVCRIERKLWKGSSEGDGL